MDIFLRNKLLVRIVSVLILLNIFSIGYLWFQKRNDFDYDRRPPKKSIKELSIILKEQLDLSDSQQSKLVQIREDFFKKEEVLRKLIKSQRDSMNVNMFNETTDTTLAMSIARRLAENEYQMELYRFDQAQQLKSICNKEQLKKFGELVLDIRDYFQPREKK